jgi:AraC-like DNA-binding protein
MFDDDLTLKSISLPPQGRWNNSPGWWCFVLIRKGRGSYSTRTFSRLLGIGDALLVRAGVGGQLSANGPAGLVATYFGFVPEHLSGLLSPDEWQLLETQASESNRVTFYPVTSRLAKRFKAFVDRASGLGSLRCRCQILELTAAALAAELPLTPSVPKAPVRVQGPLQEVLQRVSSEELQYLSIDGVARKSGYSRRHLNRLFHEHFGCSIVTIKMHLRLEKAARLLCQPETKVITVALDCGFSHLGFFSTVLKKRFGTSPAKWRQKYATSNRAESVLPASPPWPELSVPSEPSPASP